MDEIRCGKKGLESNNGTLLHENIFESLVWRAAAMLDNKGEVIAVDRDPQRFKRLKANAELAGATCIRCIQADTCTIPPPPSPPSSSPAST